MRAEQTVLVGRQAKAALFGMGSVLSINISHTAIPIGRSRHVDMNLTRLGELLDLADNADLTPRERRELAMEQAKFGAAIP
jgi:hypothetical protein